MGSLFGSNSSSSKEDFEQRTDQAVQEGMALNVGELGGGKKSSNNITIRRADENALQLAALTEAEAQETTRAATLEALRKNAGVSEQALSTAEVLGTSAMEKGRRTTREGMELAERSTAEALQFADNATRSEAGRSFEKLGQYGILAAALVAVAMIWRG